jgi:Protein of unknown function (DUF2621)
MEFVTTVIHEVAKPAEAAAFLCAALGFQLKNQQECAVVVGNGALDVRLVKTDATKQQGNQLKLEMYSNELAHSAQVLLARPGVLLIAENIQIGLERIETHVQAPFNIMICVAQEFNEDQLGIRPPLPKSLEWDEEAEDTLKDIIRIVPIEFRANARKRVTEYAEMLAGEWASICVDQETAIRALVEATPLFQHPSLQAALLKRGLDASNYFKNVAS